VSEPGNCRWSGSMEKEPTVEPNIQTTIIVLGEASLYQLRIVPGNAQQLLTNEQSLRINTAMSACTETVAEQIDNWNLTRGALLASAAPVRAQALLPLRVGYVPVIGASARVRRLPGRSAGLVIPSADKARLRRRGLDHR
jgi:hypothetical protein